MSLAGGPVPKDVGMLGGVEEGTTKPRIWGFYSCEPSMPVVHSELCPTNVVHSCLGRGCCNSATEGFGNSH